MPLPVAPTYAAAVAAPRQPGISLRRAAIYAALIGVPFALVYGLGLYLIAKVL